jgi:hypothetical protein
MTFLAVVLSVRPRYRAVMLDIDAIEDLKNAVEDVKVAVEGVQGAIEHKGTIGAAWVLGAFLFILIPSWFNSAWHSKLRYSLQYDVPQDKITMQSKLHDCNFFAAPLGEKHCDYERTVQIIYWSTSTTGSPIASVDDGKTWTTFTPDPGVLVPSYKTAEAVYITWDKKSD